MVPEADWDAFETLVERLYGERNKGWRKYLYALALRNLASMADDPIKWEVSRIQAEEFGVVRPATGEELASLMRRAISDGGSVLEEAVPPRETAPQTPVRSGRKRKSTRPGRQSG